MLKNRLKWLLSLFCIISSCVLTFLFLYLSDDKVSSEVVATSILNGTEAKEITKLKQVNSTTSNSLNDAIKNTEVVKEDNKKDNTEENKKGEETQPEEKKEETEAAKPAIVYEGMTMDELASKLNRHLKNDLSGKGYLYASYALEKGVDPYLAD